MKGGVFFIDVLGLPPQAKIVKAWTLENSMTIQTLLMVLFL
jgi:hypothetical protein